MMVCAGSSGLAEAVDASVAGKAAKSGASKRSRRLP
jgi:hypothetical protein